MSVKFCVNGNLEEKRTSLHWDDYPVTWILQNSTDFAVLDWQCGRTEGQGMK